MTRYRPARAAWIVQAIGDSPVVYAAALAHGRPLVLADSAALIWIALTDCTHPATASEVAEALAAEQGFAAVAVLGDVSAFLDELVDHGLATH
ncbi:MAG: PqqD family protein [Tetrasphaera sp.]|nr:PqqD family protein [Tetrasphaera sp.]